LIVHLERFQSSSAFFAVVKGGIFLVKMPLGGRACRLQQL
jgi:hypothetical protein